MNKARVTFYDHETPTDAEIKDVKSITNLGIFVKGIEEYKEVVHFMWNSLLIQSRLTTLLSSLIVRRLVGPQTE